MNFGLLWLEALLIALLWAAFGIAEVARLRNLWQRRVLRGIVVLLPLFWLIPLVLVTGRIKFGPLQLERSWFGYTLLLLVAYLIGTAVILYRGRQRRADMAPAAASWRRGWLALAWLLVVMMGYLTVGQMDLAARTHSALLYEKVNSRYLATLPALISEDQNAAPIYEKAFARLEKDPEPDFDDPPLSDDNNKGPGPPFGPPPFGYDNHSDANKSSPSEFLKRHTETVALLRQAAAMPVCRYDQDLNAPDLFARMPELGDSRKAANLLNLHAREAVAHGQVAEAIADATALFSMSRHFASRQSLVAALVGIGIEASGIDALEAALPAVKHPEELAGLHVRAPSSLGPMVRNALVGEERMMLFYFSKIPNIREDLGSEPKMTLPIPAPKRLSEALFRIFVMDEPSYVNMIEDAQEMAVQPYYQIREKLPYKPEKDDLIGFLTQMLAPSMSRALETLAQIEAQDACTRVAIAMTQYRLDHGALPSKLNELVPKYLDAIPADPFDGKPVHLAVKNHQWIIYSVGPDGVDDGGADLYAASTKGKSDVIFTLKP